MKFHYVSDNNMIVSELRLGGSLKGLVLNGIRPAYVTIDAIEFENTTIKDEKQMLYYFKHLRMMLVPEGKIFLEIGQY